MSPSPKEKAKDLIEKYDKLLPCEGTTTGQTPIECALIAVKEIITELLNDTQVKNEIWDDDVLTGGLNYWLKVEEELNIEL